MLTDKEKVKYHYLSHASFDGAVAEVRIRFATDENMTIAEYMKREIEDVIEYGFAEEWDTIY